MSQRSKIEWTEYTWNPVTGCSKVSSGCLNCYAERMAKRLQAMGMARYRQGFKVKVHNDLVDLPLSWRRPRSVFVNSMSDLFHERVPDSFIEHVFDTMSRCPQHTFQILTKRSERLRKLSKGLPWTDNIWIGVTVEEESVLHRIDDLCASGAKIRFLSCEPLLATLHDLPLKDLDWVIVGGESGPHARPLDASWVRSIRDQCVAKRIPFFFKQWGGPNKKAAGRVLDGQVWSEMPRPSKKISRGRDLKPH